MIGPTGVGKTEIARRLAKLAQAPFLKVEAPRSPRSASSPRRRKHRRYLLESAIQRPRRRAATSGQGRGRGGRPRLDALVGASSNPETRAKFRTMLRKGELDDKTIEIEVKEASGNALPTFDLPNIPGAQMGVLNLNDIFGKAFGNTTKKRKVTVADSHETLIADESDRLLDEEQVTREAIRAVRTTASSSSTKSQDLRRRRMKGGPTSPAKGCSATSSP
jgi:ATP-dependent HslUV protease ATP-binding subunit HslU